MTLKTSAAAHGLYPAFSKQPEINDRQPEFRKLNEPIISKLLFYI